MKSNVVRSPENQHYLEQLQELAREDRTYSWTFDGRFLNRPVSKDVHHRPMEMWAGELQPVFGVHRRGPATRWY